MTTQKTITGTVVKLSSAQTIRIETKVTKTHPIYRKRFTLTRHYIVHDENGSAALGDTVTIIQCRPISKRKHWTLVQK